MTGIYRVSWCLIKRGCSELYKWSAKRWWKSVVVCCWRKSRKFCMYILSKAIRSPVEKPLSWGRYVDSSRSSLVKSISPNWRKSPVMTFERSGQSALSKCCSTFLFLSIWIALKCSLRGFPRTNSRQRKRPRTLPTMQMGQRSHHGSRRTLIVMSTTPSEASNGKRRIQWKIEQSIYRSQNFVDERSVIKAMKYFGDTTLIEHLNGQERVESMKRNSCCSIHNRLTMKYIVVDSIDLTVVQTVSSDWSNLGNEKEISRRKL